MLLFLKQEFGVNSITNPDILFLFYYAGVEFAEWVFGGPARDSEGKWRKVESILKS